MCLQGVKHSLQSIRNQSPLTPQAIMVYFGLGGMMAVHGFGKVGLLLRVFQSTCVILTMLHTRAELTQRWVL